MAVNSFSIVGLFFSAGVNVLLAKVTGRSPASVICDRTAPHPMLEASVVNINCLVKSGYSSILGDIRQFLRVLNAFRHS